MRVQPSIITKRRILKGRDTRVGGSIIIPIDINVAETTKSMMRKGTKMTNPMMKALWSCAEHEG